MGQGFLQEPLKVTFAFLLFTIGAGCTHTDGGARAKSDVSSSQFASDGQGGSGVKQASATEQVQPIASAKTATQSASSSMMSKLQGLGTSAPAPATGIALCWQNRLEYLPDPSPSPKKATNAGIVGQLFLYTGAPKMPHAEVDGKLVVDMFDESSGKAVEPALGRWTLGKETLRKLVTNDERFGQCYALFLPWPDYQPTVTRIKLTARYVPEHGDALFADASSVTIDTKPRGSSAAWQKTTNNGFAGQGSQMGTGQVAPAGAVGSYMPAGGMNAMQPGMGSTQPGMGAMQPGTGAMPLGMGATSSGVGSVYVGQMPANSVLSPPISPLKGR